MAKIARPNKVSTSDIELNRWCIEQAMRWPVHSSPGYAPAGVYTGGGGYHQPVHRDEDIIGRANKIMAWIKQAH